MANPKSVSGSDRPAAAVVGSFSGSAASDFDDGGADGSDIEAEAESVAEPGTASPPRITPSQSPRKSTTAAPLSPG